MLYRRGAAVTVALAATLAFTATTASARDITVPPWSQQTVFALATDYSYVAEWNGPGQGWTVIGGPADHVYAGSAGVFATDPGTGDIAEYNGTPGSWTVIGGFGQQFVEGGGHLYGLGPNANYVAEWNGTPGSWTIIGGPAKHLYADDFGLVATAPNGSNGDIWRYNGTPGDWTDIGAPGASTSFYGAIAVGTNAVYRIGDTNSAGVTVVDEWSGGTAWTPILTVGNGDELGNLIAGYDGVYLGDYSPTSKSETYYEYSGTPNNWSAIAPVIHNSAGMYPLVESDTTLYGGTVGGNGTDDLSNVEVYSGSGTSWTVIGGAADPNLAAGG